jgi:Rhs element Vgr protein
MANDGRTLPTGQTTDVVTYKIFVEGAEINQLYKITSIVVERAVNCIATAHIVLLDGDVSKENFEISEKDDFLHGKMVEIKAGYRSDEKRIFKGVIVKHGLKVAKGKPSILQIECKNKAIQLSAKRSMHYFYDVTDSDLLEEVIKNSGLTAEVQSTRLKHKEMIQFYASDWDFLVMRAEANGFFVSTQDDKIVVKKPNPSQEAVVKLLYGGNVLDFELEADARTQIKALKVASWNPAEQKQADLEAEDSKMSVPGNFSAANMAKTVGNETVQLRLAGAAQDAELQAWADARLQTTQLSRIQGRVSCQGFSEILPTQWVTLAGMGARFNGKAFVSKVCHEIHLNEWKTYISIGAPSETHSEKFSNITARPVAGLIPTVHGLHIGLVTKLEGDPEGEDRIQIRLPIVAQDAEGSWARVACLDAGKERGTFFRPEIGDEVIVGFMDDDPRQAVILGMLNSSAKPAPLRAKDENPIKAIVTRSKMKLVFDDDKKEIHLETPAGQKVSISDDKGSVLLQDKNGNKILLDSKGITLESKKDIILKAQSNIKGTANANLDFKATAQVKIAGSASAELSASGTTTVKGAMVQIN